MGGLGAKAEEIAGDDERATRTFLSVETFNSGTPAAVPQQGEWCSWGCVEQRRGGENLFRSAGAYVECGWRCLVGTREL